MATGPQQHPTTHGMYSHGTFPCRVSTPIKGRFECSYTFIINLLITFLRLIQPENYSV